MLTRFSIALVASTVLTPCAAQAQGRGHGHDDVPPGQMPPAGSCRIWFDGQPPGHQPLPTDCQTAFRDVPSDARVLVGAGAGDDQGEHRGGKKEHGNKHGDRDARDEDADASPVPQPTGDCLAYTPGGRCAEVYAPAGGPTVLPDMIGAVFANEGRAWPEVRRWFGGLRLTAHVEATIGGRPTRVRWTDPNGVIVQEWVDTNGDGRADIVRVYRQGVLVHTYHQ